MPYSRDGGKVKPKHLTVPDALKQISDQKVRFIDLQFTDIQGRMQHVTIPSDSLEEDGFSDGIPKLDGSSIRGFTDIHESDMLLFPDPSTYGVLPWSPDNLRTGRMICDVSWGYGMGRFPKDPRHIAQKAEQEAKKQGFDTTYWGPEIEFFIFDHVTWNVMNPYSEQSYKIESREAPWNSGTSDITHSPPIRFKEGYFPAAPQDSLQDFRSECVSTLADFGIICDAHHHEVAAAGQCEIDMRYDTLTNMADSAVTEKYVIKNVAAKNGMVATLMPKPVFLDNASGMHVHVSLWKEGRNLMYDETDGYAELSQLGRYFGGGLMAHARALAAITNPTTNSYRRLVPGFEAPVYIAWSRRNRSANIRIPVNMKGPKHSAKKRLEYRTPDTASNPYLCFAAMLSAGIDGIKKSMEIGDPVDEDIYKLTPEKRRALGIKELPGSLKEAIECLQSDHEFLKPVFTDEIVEAIIENGIKEHGEVSRRPHPYEFYLYFDV
ncbi:MAG TPA: type I glutamate--ammonia ligase [Nitrososphaerales archaeon]|nr:type I glutamate--ammonia ligase [Nitrososphaerales archaeon]